MQSIEISDSCYLSSAAKIANKRQLTFVNKMLCHAVTRSDIE